MISLVKQEALYQNKVNSRLVSNCNRKMGYWVGFQCQRDCRMEYGHVKKNRSQISSCSEYSLQDYCFACYRLLKQKSIIIDFYRFLISIGGLNRLISIDFRYRFLSIYYVWIYSTFLHSTLRGLRGRKSNRRL